MKRWLRWSAAACTASAALMVAGCGSEPTTATRDSATFALPGIIPNYILPIAGPGAGSATNRERFVKLMWRPLIWIGNDDDEPVPNPELSLIEEPEYLDGNTKVRLTLKDYVWSDGEPVTSRDVQFWFNLVKANKDQWQDYASGEMPDNVKQLTVDSPKQLTLTLDKAYSETWFTYNQLRIVFPLPQHAWDKTSPDGEIGDHDLTPKGAREVYEFLAGASTSLDTYDTNPLWQVVSGPWKLDAYRATGTVTFVPNERYSGPTKPELARFILRSFTSGASELNALLAGGEGVDVGYIPNGSVEVRDRVEAQGYTFRQVAPWSVNWITINYNNPDVGPLFEQLYVRQALQHLIDQELYIEAAIKGYGSPVHGPVPIEPENPYVTDFVKSNPYPHDPQAAAELLRGNGWAIEPDGVSTCTRPGSGSGQCGPGIEGGQKLEFNLQYASGDRPLAQELESFKSTAAGVGARINLREAPLNTVIANATACTEDEAACSWQMASQGPGAGSRYVFPYPVESSNFVTGGGRNRNYSDPRADKLIQRAVLAGDEEETMAAYQNYLAEQVAELWLPTQQLLFVHRSNMEGVSPDPTLAINPENWRFTE